MDVQEVKKLSNGLDIFKLFELFDIFELFKIDIGCLNLFSPYKIL